MIRWEDLTSEQQQALQKWIAETFSALGELIAKAMQELINVLGPELTKLLQDSNSHSSAELCKGEKRR